MANSKRKCRNCKEYIKVNDGLVLNSAFYCDINCATSYAFKNKSKGAKIKHTAQKKTLRANDKAFRTKQAQSSFNSFIRERDKEFGCVSCDKYSDWTGQWHAGHFYTTKARPDIRFNEDNCHKQCSVCNNYLSGNIGEYRPRLIEKIGVKRYLALSLNRVKRYTCEELKEIELLYKKKLKYLK
ncbi:MAG: recombination protein NinG [Methylococcales bacterium]